MSLFHHSKKSPPAPPVYGVRVGDYTALNRAASPSDATRLFIQLRNAQVPGFIIPEVVVGEMTGEDPAFRKLAQAAGSRVIDAFLHGTEAGVPAPLHTDREWLVPPGARMRFHRIESDHTSTVELGRLTGHERRLGLEYIENDNAHITIPTMLVGEAKRGDVTVFEVSADVAHRFSSPEEGRREYAAANLYEPSGFLKVERHLRAVKDQ